MSGSFETEQEAFWAGDFGETYIDRNEGEKLVTDRMAMWSRILASTQNVASVAEFGPNIGLNLLGLRKLLPEAKLSGVEINPKAAETLRDLGWVNVHEGSILDQHITAPVDLTFTVGVLIHINPDSLPDVYDNLVAASRKYICVAEYYNPSPVAIPYRGHDDRLFKRDFAGEIMDRHKGLKLVDYGFVYHRDPDHPLDDITWFLMEK